MNKDTDIGGPPRPFPVTRRSVILAASSTDPHIRRQAFETLVAAYWKPIYKYIRLKWPAHSEDAKDLTQGFFAQALENGYVERYDPAKAKFRTYLRTCVDGFVSNERKSAQRMKRGGDAQQLSLDFDSAEAELSLLEPSVNRDMDELFHQEWVRSLFSLAVDELRNQCESSGKSLHFAIFDRHDVQGPGPHSTVSYADLSAEFGIATTQVTNYLAFARRRFRELVLEKLRELTGSDDEFQAEARRLLGIDPR